VEAQGVREWLEQLEASRPPQDELYAVLVYVAGQDVEIDPDERAAAVRRALFVHAAGGGLDRDLALDDPAGETLAADIDDETGLRRAELGRSLGALRDEAARLPYVRDALGRLLADKELAWRAFAIGLLAAALAGADEEG
jgi:hypothetical protein